ncbi:MAG: glucuronate isomerase [Bacteroidota bacterium]
MKKFLDDNFLLENKTAERLYHDYAKELPIIDYHCHLPPQDIAHNRQFNNLTEIWLEGDHYKWRAMRANGVDERYITGSASPEEKFKKWAETVPYTLRNPLYHWTHLEQKRYFGIDQILNGESAGDIYQQATSLLRTPEYSSKQLITKMKVEVICTTDDPADLLDCHEQIKHDGYTVKVLPTFRPDKSYAIENAQAYNTYLDQLQSRVGFEIKGYNDLLDALENRIGFFHKLGCRLADHGLEEFYLVDQNGQSVEKTFEKARSGLELSEREIRRFKQHTLTELARMYHTRNWTQQFHLGALRNTNTRMMRNLGPDTGFDSIGDFSQGVAMARFFDTLDSTDQLAKTILYNLNPRDNELVATMIGNFNDGSVAGKMQFGSGWWFLDQKDGMERQINALSNMGLLSRFVGMLTDSRSFMSYPRHEYFRRILCNLFGRDVENGELPDDISLLGKTIQNICYHNAKAYFQFDH